MNTLVIYDSQYGSTQRISKAIANTLREFGQAPVGYEKKERLRSCLKLITSI